MASDYLYPLSVDEALDCLHAHQGRARLIAGGTDVLPDIRDEKIAPDCLVDVTRIPGLDRIERADGFVTVGAAVTFAQIREDPFLNDHVHALVEAAGAVGALPIQNVATWVGNIVQAMPAADGAIVAIALDAEARVVDTHGATWRPVQSLFEGPGVSTVDPTREIITAIRFPFPDSPADGVKPGTAWRRVGRRAALVLPILNCAVKVSLEHEGPPGSHPAHGCPPVAQATIALGPVGPRPQRMPDAESFLKGRVPTEETIDQAARLAMRAARPRTSVMRASREYRVEIIPVLVAEALTAALRRAENHAR